MCARRLSSSPSQMDHLITICLIIFVFLFICETLAERGIVLLSEWNIIRRTSFSFQSWIFIRFFIAHHRTFSFFTLLRRPAIFSWMKHSNLMTSSGRSEETPTENRSDVVDWSSQFTSINGQIRWPTIHHHHHHLGQNERMNEWIALATSENAFWRQSESEHQQDGKERDAIEKRKTSWPRVAARERRNKIQSGKYF